MRMYSCLNKGSSLTLIELLVALSIFSLVSMGVYSVFSTAVNTHKRLREYTKLYPQIRITLEEISHDLKNAFSYSKKKSYFQGEEKNISFMSLSSVWNKMERKNTICYITYTFENHALKRLKALGRQSLSPKVLGPSEVLIENINDINFYYGKREEENYSWQRQWAENFLPSAVMIEIKVDISGYEEVFKRLISLSQGP